MRCIMLANAFTASNTTFLTTGKYDANSDFSKALKVSSSTKLVKTSSSENESGVLRMYYNWGGVPVEEGRVLS